MPRLGIAILTAVCAVALVGWLSCRPVVEDPAVVRVAISASGGWIAATAAGSVGIWSGNTTASPPAIQFRPGNGPINDLRFSPDERWLAIADRGLTLHPLAGDARPVTLREDHQNYGSIRFSPAQDAILTTTGSGRIEILNANTGATIVSACCSTIAGEVEFTADGSAFVSAGHWPRLWDARTGELLARLTPRRQFMLMGPVAIRGDLLVTGSQDGRLRMWDLRTRQPIGTPPAIPESIDTVAVDTRTGLVAYGSFGKPLRVWRPDTHRRHVLDDLRPTSNVAFAPNTGLLVAGLAGGTIEAWDIEGAELRFTRRISR